MTSSLGVKVIVPVKLAVAAAVTPSMLRSPLPVVMNVAVPELVMFASSAFVSPKPVVAPRVIS